MQQGKGIKKHKVQYVAISVDRERMNSERKTQKRQ